MASYLVKRQQTEDRTKCKAILVTEITLGKFTCGRAVRTKADHKKFWKDLAEFTGQRNDEIQC